MKRYYFELTDRSYNDLGLLFRMGTARKWLLGKQRGGWQKTV